MLCSQGARLNDAAKRRDELLTRLGFRLGINGPHAARTMMLGDLQTLLLHLPADSKRADYADAVEVQNLLGKSTKSARQLAFRHLSTLYALDLANPIFRALRRLWALDEAAQPVLALALALARDPLLRRTQPFVLQQPIGVRVPREAVEALLEKSHPHRLTASSLKSFAQNVGGTWTSAGFLTGRVVKVRTAPMIRPESLTLLMFLGYLEGRSGQRLLGSEWVRLLGLSPDELDRIATAAAHRGLLVYMKAGEVMEIRFPGFLTADEERMRMELSHVI